MMLPQGGKGQRTKVVASRLRPAAATSSSGGQVRTVGYTAVGACCESTHEINANMV
jgi:hypothetical protein